MATVRCTIIAPNGQRPSSVIETNRKYVGKRGWATEDEGGGQVIIRLDEGLTVTGEDVVWEKLDETTLKDMIGKAPESESDDGHGKLPKCIGCVMHVVETRLQDNEIHLCLLDVLEPPEIAKILEAIVEEAKKNS
jgi:hypothetical protein